MSVVVQIAEPKKAVKVLEEHNVQLIAPVEAEYVPLRHSVASIEPPAQDEPIGHIVVEPLLSQ
jgi:hypothetical protein